MKIAILGLGTVGSGVYEICKQLDDVEVVKILSRKTTKELQPFVTTDINDIINDPTIDLVAECYGGIDPAHDYIISCMNTGKHIVTANKNLISAKFDELTECAEKNGVQLRFTTSAGGGIPWLYNLKRTARCDTITEVHGIINGSCNYILDSMHTDKADFSTVLKKAQELGYAEANPESDIAGYDSQRKCVISANLAFGTHIKEKDVQTFGIETIAQDDIIYAENNDFVCKLFMNAKTIDGKVCAYVEPVFLTKDALESNVKANFNMVSLTGENVGQLSFYGQGAGKMPTGESLVQDILDIKENIDFMNDITYPAISNEVDNSKESHQYYMRFNTCEVCSIPVSGFSTEKDGSVYMITDRIPVKTAHEIAASFKKEGKPFFMAGII